MNLKFPKLRSAKLLLFSSLTIVASESDAQQLSDHTKCQEITIPLVPNTNIAKEVPNTLVKSYQNYIITGHSDLDGIGNYYPVIHVRDREGNYYLSNIVKFLQTDIEDMGGGGAYLMDMSEVTSNETVFLLGFVAYDYPGNRPSCVPFLIEMDIFSGAVLQQTILDREHSSLPYRMEVNEDHDQVLIVGETFNDWNFNPIGLSLAPVAPQGRAFAMNVARSSNVHTNWSISGTFTINGTTELNIGSKFGGVKNTPSGYMIVGEMTTVNPFPTSTIYPYATRLECAHIDFGGNIIWQRSLKLTNDKTRGVSSYYSDQHDKIFVLFQDYVSHTYGLVAMDPNSGAHGPITLSVLPGETNTSDLLLAENDDEEVLFVGGMLSNQSPITSSIFSSFFHHYKYDPVTGLFDNTYLGGGNRGNNTMNGIDYSSNKLAGYFNWQNHSFSMFTKENISFPIINRTFLLVNKNASMDGLILNKLNTSCGGTCSDRLNINTFSVNIPDTYTMHLSVSDLVPTDAWGERDNFDLDPQLTCGEYDDHYSPKYDNGPKDHELKKAFKGIETEAIVSIYDILGKEIYKGRYSDFLENRRKYTAHLDGQMIIILDTRTGNVQKMSIFNH